MRENRAHANSTLSLKKDSKGLELAKFGGNGGSAYPGILPTLGLNKFKGVDL